MKRKILIAAAALVVALGGATYALGGGNGLIFDDGKYVKPGTLDDGKNLQPEAKISLAQAIAAAQGAADGALGQVDLERYRGGVVYMVDVGSHEVRVDATDGSIAAVGSNDEEDNGADGEVPDAQEKD